MRNVLLLLTCLAIGAGCGSTSDDFDPNTGATAVLDDLNAQKDNGLFDATELTLPVMESGNAGGTSFELYQLELSDLDEIRIEVNRVDGDLRPSAYLYYGTDRPVAPVDYTASSTEVTLDYTIEETGTHYLAVRAYKGEGVGTFGLTITCTGGTCAGVPTSRDPYERASDCIVTAKSCALEALPSYNGRVGEGTANTIWDGCIEEASAALGRSCADACEVDSDAETMCNNFKGELPELADQPGSCIAEYTECLDICGYNAGAFSVYGFEDTEAYRCQEGYFGNCNGFRDQHTLCGGSNWQETGVDRCLALCWATEGAWDEGPWDGCTDTCYDECPDFEAACEIECSTNSDVDCVDNCLERTGNSECGGSFL